MCRYLTLGHLYSPCVSFGDGLPFFQSVCFSFFFFSFLVCPQVAAITSSMVAFYQASALDPAVGGLLPYLTSTAAVPGVVSSASNCDAVGRRSRSHAQAHSHSHSHSHSHTSSSSPVSDASVARLVPAAVAAIGVDPTTLRGDAARHWAWTAACPRVQ